MAAIVTLTINPAIDVSTTTARVEPTRKLRCGEARRDPGGGGVNVARVVARLGGEVTAVYPIGGFVGRLLERLVEGEKVNCAVIPVGGETREDFTIFELATGLQYRFVLPGPTLLETEWQACLEKLAALGPGPDFVCASGSLPPGVPDDFYARVARMVGSWGARLLLDTSGPALSAALDHPVHLIKPNLRELRGLVGPVESDPASLVEACRGLISDRGVGIVALSLGADGALMVTERQAWRTPALPIEPLSTVGAGDSFLGALLWALASKKTLKQAFGYAVAGGSAALLAPGTGLCSLENVLGLIDQVTIQTIRDRPPGGSD